MIFPKNRKVMKVKEESGKFGLKLNTQKTKIMASNPITSWEIDGETMWTVRDFILGGSKITADGDFGHEIKRCLFLGRKAMTKLESTLKSRDITLPTKVCLVKTMVFPVQFSSVTQSCLTLCDPMNRSPPGLPVPHQFPEFTQTHVHWVCDAIQPPHPLSSPSPPAFNLSHHQGLFKWVSSSHQVAQELEFPLQHPSFQWITRTDLL